MSIFSKTLLLLGLLQLIHAGFSIHEFNRILKISPATAASLSLPMDVKIEVLSGMLFSTLSVLFSFPKIQYIFLKDTENRVVTLNERLLPIKTNISNGVLYSSKFAEAYNTTHFFPFDLGDEKKKKK